MTNLLQYMFTILIDTSAFESERHIFSGPKFEALINYCEESKIKIVTCDIIVNEVKKHITDSILQYVKGVKEALNNNIRIALADVGELTTIKAEIKDIRDRLVEYRIKKFEDFLDQVNAEYYDYSTASLNDLVAAYFNQSAPFGTGKKNEFPDAIALQSFFSTYHDNLEQCYVVSSDGDYKRFFSNYPKVKVFETIGELIDFINNQYNSEISNLLHKAIKSKLDLISEQVKNEILDRGEFYYDDFWIDADGEIDENSIQVINDKVNLISSLDDVAYWEFDFIVRFNFDMTVADPNSMYRDPDTKDFVYVHSTKLTSKITRSFTMEVVSNFEKENIESTLDVVKFKIPDEIFYIDSETDEFEAIESGRDWEEQW